MIFSEGNDSLWEELRGFLACDWWKKGWVGGEADFFLGRQDFFFSEGKAVLLRQKRSQLNANNEWLMLLLAQLVPCTFTRRTWRSLVGWKKDWFLAVAEACYLTMTMIKPVPPFNWLSFRFQTIDGIEWRTRQEIEKHWYTWWLSLISKVGDGIYKRLNKGLEAQVIDSCVCPGQCIVKWVMCPL